MPQSLFCDILPRMINYADKNRTAAGIFLASFTILVWGITFVCTKYLLRSFSALEILAVRFAIAYAGLWMLCPHRMKLNKKSDELQFAAAGLCGVTVYQFMENMAISYTSASNVSIIVSITPIFTAIVAQIFLGEKHISFKFFAGFAVAITGIALVSFNGTAVLKLNPKGDLLAFAATVSWGFYSLFVSRINAAGYSTLPATRRIFFWALVFMVPLTAAGMLPVFADSHNMAVCLDASVNLKRFADPMNWVNLLFLGLVASSFCFAAWSFACRYLGTVRVTAGIYLIPVVTILFAFFALHEPVTLMGAAGAALTITGLFISEWKK